MGVRGRFTELVAGGSATVRGTVAAVGISLALIGPAWAQAAGDVNSFQLPPGTPTPAPPVVAPPPPVTTPSPAAGSPAASPAPPVSTPSAAPTPRATATPTARPRPTPSAAAVPRAAEAPAGSATAAADATPAPILGPVPQALPLPTDTAPVAGANPPASALPPAQGAPVWPWLVGAGAVFAAAAAWLVGRRRPEPDAYYEETAEPAPPVLQPSPPAALGKSPQTIPQPALSLADVPPPTPEPRAATQPVPQAPPPPSSAPPKAGDFITVSLSARRLSATLMNTALTYELTVTNNGVDAIGPIAVSGDMIGAHASIPPKVLLETAADGAPHHRIPRLEPGESAAMSGELRLPLAAITPIRNGAATLFVPLARFRVLAFRDGRPPVSVNHAFVIGEEPQHPGAALKPFRLDLGPRLYSSITQRELALPT